MVAGFRQVALLPDAAATVPPTGLPSPALAREEDLLAAAACLVYLVPAAIAVQLRRPWHAAIFAAAASLGASYHALNLYAGLGPAPTWLGGAAAWAAQLCALQVAFMILGPEDPLLHEAHPLPAPCGRLGGIVIQCSVPADVLVWARAVPAAALALLPARAGEHGLPWGWRQSALAAEVLLVAGCVAFWLGSQRRCICAVDVLLRARFWQRAWRCLALPAAGPLLALLAAGCTGWRALLAACHAGVAVMAASALRTVLKGSVEVLDRSPQNPPIAHRILFSPAAILLPAAGLALGLDAHAHHGWRWPTLSMAATTPAGACVLQLAAPPLALAAAATCWALGLLCGGAPGEAPSGGGAGQLQACGGTKTAAAAAALRWKETCRWLGCRFGYMGLLAGLLAVMVSEGAPVRNAVHNAFSMAFFSMVLAAELLFTAASDLASPFGHLRASLVVLLCVTMGMQLALFLLVNQYVPNNYGLPHSIYAVTEYFNMALLVLLPATWAGSAQEAGSSARRPELQAGLDLRSRLPTGYHAAKLGAGLVS